MDKISQLPDELLVKVLLNLPTKSAVSTSILSKRWKFVWMWLPKLEYDDRFYSESKSQRLLRFVDRNLPLHRAPVIESLCLSFSKGSVRSSVEIWCSVAVSHCVRELSLRLLDISKHETSLPSSFYNCKSIVMLKLIDEILVNVPIMASLPSLKTLFLLRVTYADEDSLHNLLSSCPVLEELYLEDGNFDDSGISTIVVPSLQRLTVVRYEKEPSHGIQIDTPSLKYLLVNDHSDKYEYSGHSLRYAHCFSDMPKLEEVDIHLTYHSIDNFVKSITSVKRLTLCLRIDPDEVCYGEGIVFNQLEQLELCPCEEYWPILLAKLLKDSPNLRELEVYLNHEHEDNAMDRSVCFEDQLNCVPECLLSSLESFKWTWMYGSQTEVDLVKYILRNGCCLKTATISFQPDQDMEDKCEKMYEELLFCSRGSTTCQLVID